MGMSGLEWDWQWDCLAVESDSRSETWEQSLVLVLDGQEGKSETLTVQKLGRKLESTRAAELALNQE